MSSIQCQQKWHCVKFVHFKWVSSLQINIFTLFIHTRRLKNTFEVTKFSFFVFFRSFCLYKPGMMYAMLSKVLERVSCGTTFSSGTCWVRQTSGPRAQSKESRRTDKEPETAIWPGNKKITVLHDNSCILIETRRCVSNYLHWSKKIENSFSGHLQDPHTSS